MNVTIIQPRIRWEAVYPIEAASLASVLKCSKHSITGFDAFLDPMAELGPVMRRQPPKAVFVAAATSDSKESEPLFNEIGKHTSAPVILFGPHAGEWKARGFKAVDSIIENDPEPVAERILCDVETGSLKPFYAGGFADVDRLPLPDRVVFPMDRYQAGMLVHQWPFTTVLSSRGCSQSCPHCFAPPIFKGEVRMRDPVHVAEEMRILYGKFGIRTVLFEDNDFFASEKRILRLCEILDKEKSVPFWECPNGVDPGRIDAKLIKTMAGSGCKGITFSIETFHEKYRDLLNRKWDHGRLMELIKTANGCGIRTGAYFMIGLPGETMPMIRETVDFACRLPLADSDFSIYERESDPDCFEGIGDSGSVVLSRRALEKIRKKAYFRFYVRPRVLAKLMAWLICRPKALAVVWGRIRTKLRER